jgi:hypothetical protein
LDALQTSIPETAALHGFADRAARFRRRCAGTFLRLAGTGPGPDALNHPRVGPYPCFWSGVMKKGKLSSEYLSYAKLKRRPELTEGLEQVFDDCGV